MRTYLDFTAKNFPKTRMGYLNFISKNTPERKFDAHVVSYYMQARKSGRMELGPFKRRDFLTTSLKRS